MKHTAAPWYLSIEKSQKYNSENGQPFPVRITYWIKSGSRHICLTCPPDGTAEEERANARLIAAAPAMLVEIERYLSIAKREGWHATVSTLEAIIGSVEGGQT